MTNITETISDDGIEINVDYYYEQSASQIESGHGEHEVGLMIYTELKSVNVVIAGTEINILPLMNEKQKSAIIEKLQYDY